MPTLWCWRCVPNSVCSLCASVTFWSPSRSLKLACFCYVSHSDPRLAGDSGGGQHLLAVRRLSRREAVSHAPLSCTTQTLHSVRAASVRPGEPQRHRPALQRVRLSGGSGAEPTPSPSCVCASRLCPSFGETRREQPRTPRGAPRQLSPGRSSETPSSGRAALTCLQWAHRVSMRQCFQ